MATEPGHMAPGWLVWLHCPDAWHPINWDGNRAWPHGTREAGMATGSCQMIQGWLGWQQGWPRGTRVAVIVKRSGHMVLGRL